MWLWLVWVVLGFGEPWSVGCSCLLGRALLTDVRLWGWGQTQREAGAIAPLQNEPILGPLHSWRGLTPTAGSLGSLLSEPTPDGGPALSSCPQMLIQFLLPPYLLDADPKAPLILASVVLVWGLKQHWTQAPAPIILGSGTWSWERPGLEEFLANGKMEAWATPCLAHLRGQGRPCIFLEHRHRFPGCELNTRGGGPFPPHQGHSSVPCSEGLPVFSHL